MTDEQTELLRQILAVDAEHLASAQQQRDEIRALQQSVLEGQRKNRRAVWLIVLFLFLSPLSALLVLFLTVMAAAFHFSSSPTPPTITQYPAPPMAMSGSTQPLPYAAVPMAVPVDPTPAYPVGESSYTPAVVPTQAQNFTAPAPPVGGQSYPPAVLPSETQPVEQPTLTPLPTTTSPTDPSN